MKILVTLLLLVSFTSCYRMPTDEDYCVIPTTNNKSITREKAGPPIPGVQY
jgi:hypothetical protein